jgi:hypothetical protein
MPIDIIIITVLLKEMMHQQQLLQIQIELASRNMWAQLPVLSLKSTKVRKKEHPPIKLLWLHKKNRLSIRTPQLEPSIMWKMLKTMLLIDNGLQETIDLTGLKLKLMLGLTQTPTEELLNLMFQLLPLLLLNKKLWRLSLMLILVNLKLMPRLQPKQRKMEL